jgi:hypothetical protein
MLARSAWSHADEPMERGDHSEKELNMWQINSYIKVVLVSILHCEVLLLIASYYHGYFQMSNSGKIQDFETS